MAKSVECVKDKDYQQRYQMMLLISMMMRMDPKLAGITITVCYNWQYRFRLLGAR